MLASSTVRASPKSVILTSLARPGLDQDVSRLDVPVNQPHVVGGGQAQGDLPADLHHIHRLQRARPIEPLLEGFAGDELHHQVGQRLLLDRIHLDDVLVPDLGRRPGLAQKPLAGGGSGGDLRGQHLDRDHAVQRFVERAEHDAEPALAEHFENLVMSDPADGVRPGRRLQEIEPAILVFARFVIFIQREGGVFSRGHPSACSTIERSWLVVNIRPGSRLGQLLRGRFHEEITQLGMDVQQPLDLAAEQGIALASRFHERHPFFRALFSSAAKKMDSTCDDLLMV